MEKPAVIAIMAKPSVQPPIHWCLRFANMVYGQTKRNARRCTPTVMPNVTRVHAPIPFPPVTMIFVVQHVSIPRVIPIIVVNAETPAKQMRFVWMADASLLSVTKATHDAPMMRKAVADFRYAKVMTGKQSVIAQATIPV